MPRHIQVIVQCDLDGDETDDNPTLVSLDGREIEVDLCQAHRDEVRVFLAPLFQYGHKPQKEKRKPRRSSASPPPLSATGSTPIELEPDEAGNYPCPLAGETGCKATGSHALRGLSGVRRHFTRKHSEVDQARLTIKEDAA